MATGDVGSPCLKISVSAPRNYGFLDTEYAYQKDKLTFTFGRWKSMEEHQTFFVDYTTIDGFEGRLTYKIYWSYETFVLEELNDEEARQFTEML